MAKGSPVRWSGYFSVGPGSSHNSMAGRKMEFATSVTVGFGPYHRNDASPLPRSKRRPKGLAYDSVPMIAGPRVPGPHPRPDALLQFLQQARRVWTCIGAFHICLRTFTLTEAWAWARPEWSELVDCSASPWDSATCRPNHADKRRAWRRSVLGRGDSCGSPTGVHQGENSGDGGKAATPGCKG